MVNFSSIEQRKGFTFIPTRASLPLKDRSKTASIFVFCSSRAAARCFMWFCALLLLDVASYGDFDFREQRVSFSNMRNVYRDTPLCQRAWKKNTNDVLYYEWHVIHSILSSKHVLQNNIIYTDRTFWRAEWLWPIRKKIYGSIVDIQMVLCLTESSTLTNDIVQWCNTALNGQWSALTYGV